MMASFLERSYAEHSLLYKEIGYLFLLIAAKTQQKLEAVNLFLRTDDDKELSFCPMVRWQSAEFAAHLSLIFASSKQWRFLRR